MKLVAYLFMGTLNGFIAIFKSPITVFSIFEGKRYHFMNYPILLVSIIGFWGVVRALMHPYLGEGEISWLKAQKL